MEKYKIFLNDIAFSKAFKITEEIEIEKFNSYLAVCVYIIGELKFKIYIDFEEEIKDIIRANNLLEGYNVELFN